MEEELECPHCGGLIIIEQINCGIFRHGTYKTTGQQIPPHLSQIECERLINNGEIFGCGKPFRHSTLQSKEETYEIKKKLVICDYI